MSLRVVLKVEKKRRNSYSYSSDGLLGRSCSSESPNRKIRKLKSVSKCEPLGIDNWSKIFHSNSSNSSS